MLQQFLEVFRPKSAECLAQRELEEAKRELLSAQTHAEFSVQLVAYNQSRIKRLTAYIKAQE